MHFSCTAQSEKEECHLVHLIMEDCTKEVFQYYTIIRDQEDILDGAEGNNNNQVVYLTVDHENEVRDVSAENPSSENNVLGDKAMSLGSDVQIITLEDGRVFMTTTPSDNENFESVEPQLIPSEDSNQYENIDDKSTENSNDTDYEIVQVIDSAPQMYEMVYCDVDSTTENVSKKEKSFICLHEGCGKMYSVTNDLNIHMRSHSENKPYLCTEEGCDKAFSTNYSLKSHIRTHTGEKPYGCAVCEKCFKTSGDLQKHHRIHTGEKPFLCPIEGCGKSFTTSNIRKVHIRCHTGERPYTCTYPDCGKAFSSSTNYKNHVRIHSGEKPFVCNFKGCGKRFTEYSSLYKHNLVHQFDRPFTCAFCGQTFKQDPALKQHKRVKHNVIVASDGTEIIVNLQN